MPMLKLALFASLVAVAVAVDTDWIGATKWVVAAKGKDCVDTCKNDDPRMAKLKAGSKTYKCDGNVAAVDKRSLEAILEVVEDTDGVAKCKSFVDVPTPEAKKQGKYPMIDRGVCFFWSKSTKISCGTAADDKGVDDEHRICPCRATPEPTKNRKLDPTKPIKYHAEYVLSLVPTVKFSIKFPFFDQDAFECLEWTFNGRKAEGSVAAKPEALWKIRDAIMGTLGTSAADISFVAPETISDPLIAEVDVYADPKSLSGAGSWLTGYRIKQIGIDMIKKYPELKLCSHATDGNYETEFKTRPVLPASAAPLGPWSPASKSEASADVELETPSVLGVSSLGCFSAGALLGAAGVVMWSRVHQSESQDVALLPAVSE